MSRQDVRGVSGEAERAALGPLARAPGRAIDRGLAIRTGAATELAQMQRRIRLWWPYGNTSRNRTPNAFTSTMNLHQASGMLDELVAVTPRSATVEEVVRVHDRGYHDRIVTESAAGGGDAGGFTPFGKGSYEIALLSAGGCMAAAVGGVGDRSIEERGDGEPLRPGGVVDSLDRSSQLDEFVSADLTVVAPKLERDLLAHERHHRLAEQPRFDQP